MDTQTVEDIGTLDAVERDLTAGTDYRRLVAEELEHYSAVEVTEELTEGGVHSHKAWGFNYEYLARHVFKTTFWDEAAARANRQPRPRLLSLGCGYGGVDLRVARGLKKPHELVAVDLNPGLFREALRRADREGFNIKFKCVDLNFADIRPASFDVIYAFASLHHVLNLEHLLEAIHGGLKPDGRLVVLDIIGQTQVLHWRENVEFAADLVSRLPRRHRPSPGPFWTDWARRIDPYTILSPYVEPADQVSMEGIRQEEVEPLLNQWFQPEKLFRYNAFMRLLATNPYLGDRLDPDRPADRRYLERLIRLDLSTVRSGRLRPTELFGVFAKR